MLRDWRRSSGFSLVELTVTVTIVGIMAVVGVPPMVDFIKDARLAAQVDQLMGFIGDARMAAIKERKDYTVCPSASPDTDSACSTDTANWSKGVLIFDGTAVVRRLAFPEGTTVSYDDDTILFRGTLGSWSAPDTDNAEIGLCVKGRKMRVIHITPSGRLVKEIDSATTCS